MFAQRYFNLKCLIWISCFILDSQVYPYQVSSLDSKFCPVNWTVDLEISCIGGKVNCDQLAVKSHENWPTSTLWTHMNHLVKFGSQSHKKFDQITKRAKWSFLGFWLYKGNFWLFNLANGKPSSHMYSRTQWNYLDILNKFKRSQMHKIDRWIFQSTESNLTVYWKVKLWLFGQNQVSRFIFHQDMSNYEICSSRNLKSQIRVWNEEFSLLRIFLSYENP